MSVTTLICDRCHSRPCAGALVSGWIAHSGTCCEQTPCEIADSASARRQRKWAQLIAEQTHETEALTALREDMANAAVRKQ